MPSHWQIFTPDGLPDTNTRGLIFFLHSDLLLDSEICQHYGATRPQKQRKRKTLSKMGF